MVESVTIPLQDCKNVLLAWCVQMTVYGQNGRITAHVQPLVALEKYLELGLNEDVS